MKDRLSRAVKKEHRRSRDYAMGFNAGHDKAKEENKKLKETIEQLKCCGSCGCYFIELGEEIRESCHNQNVDDNCEKFAYSEPCSQHVPRERSK